MKRKATRALWGALALLLSCALAGCSLALVGGEDEAQAQDRLCGMRIEYTASDSMEWEAEQAFVPDAYEGDALGVYLENEDRWVAIGSVSDGRTHIKETDEGTEISCEGTIYLVQSAIPPETLVRMHPVYQRADGTLYEGVSTSVVPIDGFGTTLEETHTTTQNGDTKRYSMRCALNLRMIDALQQVRVLEMSADHAPLSDTTYTREALEAMQKSERALNISPTCAYVLVEERSVDGAGAPVESYAMYNPRAKQELYHTCYFGDADGVARGILLHMTCPPRAEGV